MTHSYLKASQKLFYSVISINLQIQFVKESRPNVIVLSLLFGVLGLGGDCFLTGNNEERGVYRSLQMAPGLGISSSPFLM